MSHAKYAPSKAVQWINCPGSMAFPENQVDGGSSTFADNGTASHEWAAWCLKHDQNADALAGAKLMLNDVEYVMDEERIGYVQEYLDWCRSLIQRQSMFIEHRVNLRPEVETDGTTDCSGINPEEIMLSLDLKYGVGERVFAKMNAQGLSYAFGMLKDLRLMGHEPKGFRIGIGQPRLQHWDVWPPLDEPPAAISVLDEFAMWASKAIAISEDILAGKEPRDKYLNPDYKTCRWCRATAICPALSAKVQKDTTADFEIIQATGSPLPPQATPDLALAYNALPLIDLWVKAVKQETTVRVTAGETVIGVDGEPLKFVEGKQGDRKFKDKALGENMIIGQLGPSAYEPQKVISLAAAAKILDKKKTAEIWKMFLPNIDRAPGRPMLVLGSDPRTPYSGSVASADDFEIQEE